MSTEGSQARGGSRTLDLRAARILRYSVGVTATAAIAFSVAWPLFFLTPVLAAVFLAMPLPAPTVRDVVQNITYVLAAFALGITFTLFLLPYPLVYVPALGLALFHIYYLANRGGPLWLVLMSLIAVLLLPMLGTTHDALASGVAFYFVLSSFLAVVSVFLAHRLVPDPPGGARAPAARPFPAGYSQAAALTALKSTSVILPLAVLFIAANLSGQILVLMFAAIFSLSPELSKGRDAGRNSLISTLTGGLVALVFYALIVAAPELAFFVALLLLTMLLYATGIFSDSPNAKYLASAATATVILLGSAMGEDVNIADKFAVRVGLTVAAILYVVAAFAALERFSPRGARIASA